MLHLFPCSSTENEGRYLDLLPGQVLQTYVSMSVCRIDVLHCSVEPDKEQLFSVQGGGLAGFGLGRDCHSGQHSHL